jgi:hypothetical protein
MNSSFSSPSRPRDIRLDSLRGLMVVGMALNHIASPLHLLTDHPLGYTSAAEGFVFLSGLVAGLVYSRRRQRLGPAAVRQASWARACTIYAWHLALIFGLLLWTNAFIAATGTLPGNAPPEVWLHPAAALTAASLLVYQPPLLDILPLYAGFMILLPPLLAALDRGHYGRIWIASVALWLATQFLLPPVSYISGVIQIGAFNWGAWQLLFVLGATFGHAWATERQLLRSSLERWLVPPLLALCAYCFVVRHWYVPAPFASFADLVNKNNLAPVRLLNTLALFYLVHAAFVRWPRAFSWRPLALLGRHSLVIFCVHVAVAYVLYAFPQYVSNGPVQTWLGTGIMLGALYLVAWRCEQARPAPAPGSALPHRAPS